MLPCYPQASSFRCEQGVCLIVPFAKEKPYILYTHAYIYVYIYIYIGWKSILSSTVGIPSGTGCRHLCWRSNVGSTLHSRGTYRTNCLIPSATHSSASLPPPKMPPCHDPCNGVLGMQRIAEIADLFLEMGSNPFMRVIILGQNSLVIQPF